MKYTELRPTIKTGDLVFTAGNHLISKAIKESIGSRWTHLSMAVWGRDLGPTHEADRLYVWEATGKGVGEQDFAEASATPGADFLSRLLSPGAGDIMLRRLEVERTPEMLAALRAHCDEMRGRPYKIDKMQMLRCRYPWLGKNEQDLTSLFCWEAVAAAYQAMGLLPVDPPANTYPIWQFTSKYDSELPLLLGARLGEEISVQL